LGLPLTVWFGIAIVASLFVTAGFGVAFHRFHGPVFRYHRFFAFLTLILALFHLILVVL